MLACRGGTYFPNVPFPSDPSSWYLPRRLGMAAVMHFLACGGCTGEPRGVPKLFKEMARRLIAVRALWASMPESCVRACTTHTNIFKAEHRLFSSMPLPDLREQRLEAEARLALLLTNRDTFRKEWLSEVHRFAAHHFARRVLDRIYV